MPSALLEQLIQSAVVRNDSLTRLDRSTSDPIVDTLVHEGDIKVKGAFDQMYTPRGGEHVTCENFIRALRSRGVITAADVVNAFIEAGVREGMRAQRRRDLQRQTDSA